ncbi:MAG: hypothetical protein GC190_21310 [Alphaproteobacteria bacterium]|nr:hypothetical protein [Alphaproteobacteria bacterium]
MSNITSAQIKTLSTAIADIYLPASCEPTPRAVGDVLRPLLIEMRKSRLSGQPMSQEIIERFCTPPSETER